MGRVVYGTVRFRDGKGEGMELIERLMNGMDRWSKVVAFWAALIAVAWIIIPAILTIFLR